MGILLILILLAACTPTTVVPTEQSLSAPRIISSLPNDEFVDSRVDLVWEWDSLQANQYFAVRLWVDDLPPQEIWIQESQINAQTMIDAFSREVGSYSWQVAVVQANDQGGFQEMGSEWSEVQTLQRVRRLTPSAKPLDQLSDTARSFIEQPFSTQSDLIDTVRDWVHQHTEIGDELLHYAPDYADAAQQMFAYANGQGSAPQMYCNGMSTVMLTVLGELGIESRLIFLYGEVPGYISQHTVLEVFNQETQYWEVHDPTFNHYFLDEAGNRTEIQRMVFGAKETLQVCGSDHICTELTEADGIYGNLDAFRYGYSSEFYVNPDRLNLSRRIEAFGNQNFAEFVASNTGLPVLSLTFRFDSRE